MNITDQQLKAIAIAGGLKNAEQLEVKRSENYFELGSLANDGTWISSFSLKFMVGACTDSVEFESTDDTFNKEAARTKMENLGLIEKL